MSDNRPVNWVSVSGRVDATVLYHRTTERSGAVGLISWVIFGAIVGWIAAKLAGNDSQQGLVLNTVLGVIGALAGGFLWELVQDDEVEFGWDIGSLAIAILGGVVVSWGYAYLTRNRA